MLWIFLFNVWIFMRTQDCFYSCLSSGLLWRGSKSFFCDEISDQPLALHKLVASTFNIERQWSPNYINVLFRISYTVLFQLMKTVKLLLFLAFCPDCSESSQDRNWNFSMKPFYFLLLSYDSFCLTHHTDNSFFTLSVLLIHIRYYIKIIARNIEKLTQWRMTPSPKE